MRFSSLDRMRAPTRDPAGAAGAVRGCCLLIGVKLLAVIALALVPGSAYSQPPGTVPSSEMLEQAQNEDELPIHSFMFLSDSNNPVLMPGFSWEEFERLADRESGIDADRQSYSFQELKITGSTEGERAELQVVLRMSIEPTEGRWVSIPLRMGNFHRLAPPDVSGVDEHFMTLASDESGYLLFVKTDTRNQAMLRMRVAARVENSSTARSLAFHLPNVTASVELTADEKNATGEVVGRGDETLMTEHLVGAQTRFDVNSGGDRFSLRWGKLARSGDEQPRLEVNSQVDVRWDSPQDQPIASVSLTVQNMRGSIDSFQLRLPRGSVVLDTPRLGVSGQVVELGAATVDGDSELREVSIPPDERQQTIELNFDVQLANENATAETPLNFRVPEVVGSLRHRGEIVVRVAGDYRLRWRGRAWVRSELGAAQDEGTPGRVYRFRFDRASFSLPLWLGDQQRQLRMTSESEITVRESIASLEMTIRITGQTSEGRLQLDDASWQISSIEDLDTGESLESFPGDSYRVIEIDAVGTEESSPVLIRAERSLDPGQSDVRLEVPRVVGEGEQSLVQSSTVNIIHSGRTFLVVDMGKSTGLSRVVSPEVTTRSDSTVSSYRVSAQDQPAVIVGTMTDQEPRIILASQANVELDGSELRTTVNWNISSRLDLEGRLPIRIPSLRPIADAPDAALDDAAGELSNTGSADALVDVVGMYEPSDWVVTVDDLPATLEPNPAGDDHFDLVSDRLAIGSMSIRWRRTQSVSGTVRDGSSELVSLPRPDVPDVTVRGTTPVTLQGNQQFELISADSPGMGEVELEGLVRDPFRIRFQSRDLIRAELSVREVVLRTAIGRDTRHEQVLATVQGGESFRVGLPPTAREVLVEAFIDNSDTPIPVRREAGALIVALPGDDLTHMVDLRVWIAMSTSSSWATIKPSVKLPLGIGRVYWQIVAPQDGHVVWAAPTLGRSMSWKFENWQLYREPRADDQALMEMVATSINRVSDARRPLNTMPRGNRYLYVGSDLRSFRVIVVSRLVLWICIGSIVLITGAVLTNFQRARHPITALVAAVLFAGLIAIAPDAAVLVGQVGIIALVLVIVMTAVRVLVAPARNQRVFATAQGQEPKQPSTRSIKPAAVPNQTGVSTTQALPPPSPTEASS